MYIINIYLLCEYRDKDFFFFIILAVRYSNQLLFPELRMSSRLILLQISIKATFVFVNIRTKTTFFKHF